MTNDEWASEVRLAIAGTAWRLFSAACQQHSPVCFADCSTAGHPQLVQVSLDRHAFRTIKDRKAEILRQLAASKP